MASSCEDLDEQRHNPQPLQHCSYLKECPVSHGDTLIVLLVPADTDLEGSAEQCF